MGIARYALSYFIELLCVRRKLCAAAVARAVVHNACIRMQSLAPEYAKAALRLADSHPHVVLAKVDATAESSLAERFGIDGFPTLKWISADGEVDYSGGRTE